MNKLNPTLWTLGAALLVLLIVEITGKAEINEWRPGKEYLRHLREETPSSPADFYLASGQGDGVNAINTVKIVVHKPDNAPEVTLPPPPTPEENAFANALDTLKSGNLPAAEIALMALVEKYPQHVEAWRQLGDCRYNLGKVDAAISAYKSALAIAPENYLAKRGEGVAMLYLGYDFYEQDNYKLAHRYFQRALQLLHECLSDNNADQLAAYGQALAAEGVSRELHRIASKALAGDNEETAKNIIRNCLDILDVAITATEDRLIRRANDDDARLLLGGLLLRRARILEPFGHLAEASDNLRAAVEIYQPIIQIGGSSARIAKKQTEICRQLLENWDEK